MPNSLDTAKVDLIRYLTKYKAAQTEIATQVRTSRKTVYGVQQGKTYRHVPKPTSLRQFPNYDIYPSGIVANRNTGKLVRSNFGATQETVRIVDANSRRVRVPVRNLLDKAFKAPR
jgi:hypothetical protein